MYYILLAFVLSFTYLNAQISDLDKLKKLANWEDAGLQTNLVFESDQIINFKEYAGNKKADNALKEIFGKYKKESVTIFFPEGEYLFSNPIHVPKNVLLKGAGSDKTHLIFELGNRKTSAILLRGNARTTITYSKSIKAGDNFIIEDGNLPLNKGNIVKIYQGENEWGKSSSGNKKYQKGQILRVKGKIAEKVIFHDKIKLDYTPGTGEEKEIKIQILNPVSNSGVENLKITRNGVPEGNGHAILHLDIVYNCIISGVESTIGANNHLFLRNALHCEVRGSYFSGAHNTGGGGNGYGVSVGNSATANLIEDNIFSGLRHSIIFATSANSNVAAYNASFDKPIMNIDEASISLHGHYPYMNLFEGNYVEFVSIDFVWGENGPYNVFFKNEVYDDGIFGFINSKELEIERGNNNNFIIANIANIKASGDNIITENLSPGQRGAGVQNQPHSLYAKRTDLLPGKQPVYTIRNGNLIELPARERFGKAKKTVDREVVKSKNTNKSTDAFE